MQTKKQSAIEDRLHCLLNGRLMPVCESGKMQAGKEE